MVPVFFGPATLGGSFATVGIGSDHALAPGRVLDLHPGGFPPAALLQHPVAESSHLRDDDPG